MGAGHLDILGCPNIQRASKQMGAYKHMEAVWMPPKSPHTSKLKSLVKSCSTAVVKVFFFPQVVWEGVRGSKGFCLRGTLDNGLWI